MSPLLARKKKSLNQASCIQRNPTKGIERCIVVCVGKAFIFAYPVAFKEIPQRELREKTACEIAADELINVAFKEIPQRELRAN